MAEYSVEQFIGKTLTAKKQLVAYYLYPKSNSIFVIPKGANIGVVYSYVHDPDNAANVYWQFKKPDGKYFYVKHDYNSIGLNPQETVKSVEELKKEAEEQAKKEEKGAFVYYVEKWSPYLIGFALVGIAAKIYISKSQKQ